MISERDAERAEAWVREAQKAGASVLYGGAREGTMFPPTVHDGDGAGDARELRGGLRAGGDTERLRDLG